MSKSLQWINWSHSFISNPEFIVYPKSEKELKDTIAKAFQNNTTLKIVGSGHSCSLISATQGGYLLDFKEYNKIINFEESSGLLTVEGGTSLEKISKFALKNKMALPNLGTIVSQSISGAISTGTHGSGIQKEAIDQCVVCFTIITAKGEVKVFDKRIDAEAFYVAVVGIGALGVISQVTIQLVKEYNLSITTKAFSFDEMIANIHQSETDEFMRFWWAPHTNKVQYWTAHKTKEQATKQSKLKNWYQDIFLGNRLHEFGLWFTSYFSNLIPSLNKVMFGLLLNKEHNYVTDFLDGFTLPILVKQSVMEYGIPIEDTAVVLQKIKKLLTDKKYKVHMPIEVRFAPKNSAALSMAYDRTTCYIGIIAYKPYGKALDYQDYFKDVHAIFKEHKGRPHWAKVTHYSKEELNALYPNFQKFKDLRKELDPNGMFLNTFLKRIL